MRAKSSKIGRTSKIASIGVYIERRYLFANKWMRLTGRCVFSAYSLSIGKKDAAYGLCFILFRNIVPSLIFCKGGLSKLDPNYPFCVAHPSYVSSFHVSKTAILKSVENPKECENAWWWWSVCAHVYLCSAIYQYLVFSNFETYLDAWPTLVRAWSENKSVQARYGMDRSDVCKV